MLRLIKHRIPLLSKFLVVALFLNGCSHSNNSYIDSNFQPGVSTSVAPRAITPNSFAINSSSLYTPSNPASVDFLTTTSCELTAASQTDSTNSCTSGFGDGVTSNCGGKATGVIWDSALNAIRLSQTASSTNMSDLDSSWMPQASAIVGLWHLNETTGSSTLADAASMPHPITTGSGVIPGSAAKLSGGVVCDGSTGSFDLADSTFAFPNTTFSVALWFKTTSTANAFLISNGADAGSNAGWGIYLTGGALQPSMKNTGGNSNFRTSASSNLNDGNWHHLAAVITTDTTTASNNTMTLYIDGMLNQGTMTLQGNLPYSNPGSNRSFGLCGRGMHNSAFGGSYYTGSLDEIAIWNSALQPADVKVIYSRQAANYSGTFISRAMDSALASPTPSPSPTSWTNFTWTTSLPFFKPLPDTAGSETNSNYTSQTSGLMVGNIALYHLDEASWNGSAGEVKDSSGNLNNGQRNGGTGNTVSNGLFGRGGLFNQDGGILIGPLNGFSSTAATYSAWFLYKPVISGTGYPNIWTHYTSGTSQMRVGVNSTTLKLSYQEDNGSISTSITSINAIPSGWNHVVMTFDASPGVQLAKMYLNGVYQGSSVYTGNAANQFYIGVRAADNFYSGVLDEIAVWNRVLTDGTSTTNEILELYRRGANRVKYQVRVCADKTCSANPAWLGPDGTNQTYFSELHNNANPIDGGDLVTTDSVLTGKPSVSFSNFTSLVLGTKEFFQYRAILESDDSPTMNTHCTYGGVQTWCSPEVSNVKVGPDHYDTSSPSVTSTVNVPYLTLSGFSESIGTCTSGVTYVISKDAGVTWYYWSAGTWTLSNGLASQSSSATIINANISSFAAGTLKFRAFLNSTGLAPCELKNITIQGMQ